MLSELLTRNPTLFWTGLFHLFLAILFACATQFDSRQVLGLNVWIKPFKFALSIWLYLWTLAWLMADLRLSGRAAISAIAALTMILEIALIAFQAFRGRPSHFNTATPLDITIFGTMGVVIVINSLAIFFLTLQAFSPQTHLPDTYLAGIRTGLVLFLAGSAIGAYMSPTLSHTVGAPDGGPGLPLLNWSTQFGDLRVAHFVGLHAIQILPLLGWTLRASAPAWTIYAAASLYATATLLTFLQAIRAIPLIRIAS